MAEQLSLFDPPKKVYAPGPPDLRLAYKFLYSSLQRLRNIRAMPWNARELAETTGYFERYCPMFEHEGPQMLAEFHALVRKLDGTDINDSDTWLPEED
ncbi:MAG: hypothetical protein RL186_1228 [Pseudomonadota bacterium]|jgi:hypothetical protein